MAHFSRLILLLIYYKSGDYRTASETPSGWRFAGGTIVARDGMLAGYVVHPIFLSIPRIFIFVEPTTIAASHQTRLSSLARAFTVRTHKIGEYISTNTNSHIESCACILNKDHVSFRSNPIYNVCNHCVCMYLFKK